MTFKTLLQVSARSGAMMSRRGMATGTGPRMKAYAPAAAEASGAGKRKQRWGEYLPVYVAVGMIALAAGLGVHQMKQQLMHAPGVSVKKSKRRDTLPELAEPERAVEDSDQFIRKSFFRKVAHVQEVDSPIPDTIGGDVFTRKPKAETLKDVGVDPNPRTH